MSDDEPTGVSDHEGRESQLPGPAGPWDRLELSERSGGVRISVHVRPRSSRSKILGVRDRSLDVALTSPPADGAANTELIKLLARALGVRPSDVSIAVGSSGRTKVIQINGVGVEQVKSRLRSVR
jgi:uncharacterized protein (TIGR00251 family)